MARAFCHRCHRPASNCLCRLATPIPNAIGVIVLQHPQERSHARGSAIIAELCLQDYQCWVADDFNQHEPLQQLLAEQAEQCALVFPAAHAQAVDIDHSDRSSTAFSSLPRYLLFIDASWRKAKKIWHTTPALQRLNCIALQTRQTSNYRIRKSPGPGMLSSIEAISACLSWFDRDTDYRPMLRIFEQMIERQIEHMGQSVYQNNYRQVAGDAET